MTGIFPLADRLSVVPSHPGTEGIEKPLYTAILFVKEVALIVNVSAVVLQKHHIHEIRLADFVRSRLAHNEFRKLPACL